MRAMKDSGVEWIGEIPEQWNQMPLVRWVTSRDGGAWGDLENGDNNDVVCLRIADFDYPKLTIKKTDDYTVRNYETSIIERLQLDYGDILIEKSGGGEKTPVGRAIMYTGDFRALFANFMDRLRVTKELSSRYFLYIWTALYLCGHVNPFIKQTTGIQNLDIRTMLATTMAPLPSLIDQSCIATFLDTKCAQIDVIIEKQQQVIEKLKAYKQSVITEAVTKGLDPTVPMKDSGVEWIGMVPEHWEIVPLKKQLDSIIDYRGKTPTKSSEGVFLVTARNIKNGIIDYSLSQEYIEESEYEITMRRGKPSIGDILFTTEAPLGEVANVDREDIALAQRIIKFKVQEDILDSYFLKYWLMSSGLQYYLQSLSTGSTAAGIKSSKLFMLILVLPPLRTQDMIVHHLDSFSRQINLAIEKKIALVDSLLAYKKSLIYEAVTGKMEV